MASDLQKFTIKTRAVEKSTGKMDIVNITDQIKEASTRSQIKNGILNIFMPGSTGGISTIEFEPGLINEDIPNLLQKMIPEGLDYAHHQTWGDHNGAGHLRSFLIYPSICIPIYEGKPILGTWQQVIYCEFDEKPRNRTIYCQFVG